MSWSITNKDNATLKRVELADAVERIRLWLLLLVTAVTLSVSAAGSLEQPMLQQLNICDGLAGESVHDVITDHKGYTWIATTGGVNVFDGRNLMTLHIQNEKGRTLEVTGLCETRSQGVFAATEGGLYQLTSKTGRFQRVFPEVEHPNELLAVGDTIYIASEQGFLFYDGRQLNHQDMGPSRKGLDNVARHYVRDEHGIVWFLGRYKLYSYHPQTKRIDTHDLATPFGGKFALSMFDIVKGRFFIGTRNNGLFVYDPQSRQARHLDEVGKIVTSVRRTHEGLIAVATDGTGAWLLATEDGRVTVRERFSMDGEGMHHLRTNALYNFYRDRNGINWLGTVRHGLLYSPHNSGLFLPYSPDGFSTLGLNVRSFLVHGDQSLFGLQNGLWVTDGKNHLHRFFTPVELGGHIVNNIVWWRGQYIIGMFDGGVRVLNPQTLTLSNLPIPLMDETGVSDIKVAPDSALWIGCSDGLFIVKGDGSYRQLTEQNSHITGGIIISITFDADGNGWLTGAKGMSLYSAVSQEIVETDFPKGFFHQEPYMRGFAGHDGLVYMRNGPQIFYTTRKMERFGELKLPVSLVDRWCRGMVDDHQGRLWLASERGLLEVDYEGSNLIQMGDGEGLLGDQISELRLDGDSTLWIATSQGLFYATRESLSRWIDQYDYHVSLYNIRVGSDLLDISEMSRVTETGQIRLSWHFTSQVLQAEPVLLDYANQQGRLYEYRVDGGKWLLVDSSQPINVRRLLMGHHVLTIRMAGVKGTETDYKVIVVPSVWSFVELLLLFMAAVALWLWWHLRKNTKVLLRERNEIEDALIESEALRVKSEEFADALQESGSIDSLQKYQKVKFDEDECAEIVKRMKGYLERERVYTNADLKMKDLADVLHLSAPKLSQVFNLYLKENYYEFINRYRLEEFKRLIDAGEYKRFTITALSEQCGFKKSNFFSTFRKVEGVTPSEYLKKRGI